VRQKLKSCRKVKSLVEYSEVQNVSDTSFNDGKIEGELSKALEITKNLLAVNIAVEIIAQTTGLSLSVVKV
jgi:hypothetical protein